MNKIKASVFFREISGPDIVLRSERGDIDLHAFMSFKELRYSVDRTLVLRWNTLHSQAVKIKDGFVATVELVFVGVLKLGVRPRDPEMPFDTDEHLVDFEVQQRVPIQVAFHFNGGMSIDVCADDAYVELGFETEPAAKAIRAH